MSKNIPTTTAEDSAKAGDLPSVKERRLESCNFHVVGVGASAGGLEAIEKFFGDMPSDTGAAYVVVQHLSPDFESHMAELLSRKTELEVKSVTNEMEVKPNAVYLIPPNTEMTIANGRLLLTERDRSETLNLPIDHFFRSLSNECQERAIGVILSGTGSDGSRGVLEINEAGGLVIAQDEDSAKFGGMPASAQQTNAVHLVLPPERMAQAITTYMEQALSPDSLARQELIIAKETGIGEVFRLLRRNHNIDFSLYKPTTVQRRIDRRISLGSFNDIENYAEALGNDPAELSTLHKDLLIGVTEFFRDRLAFEMLKTTIIPKIIQKRKSSYEPIRVWVAGCASGEEAYSIAIAFREALAELKDPPAVKIFATDVHQLALQTASRGIYPEESFSDMPDDILEKYFNRTPGGYEVTSTIRGMIVFAPHNVINDAPFTRLDLVTCRNMLIYLQPVVQKKVISLFHFALRTGSYMFLGPSETPGDLSDEFDVEEKKWRIYRKRRDVRLTGNIRLPLLSRSIGMSAPIAPGRPSRATPESQLLATYDALLDRTMPPSFLVDEQGQLIHSFGGAERFLQIRGGRLSTGIMDIIHVDLKTSVAGALQHAAKEQKEIRYNGISVHTGMGLEHVRLLVVPIRDPRTEVINTLISIEPIEKPAEVLPPLSEDVDVSELTRNHVAMLENELRYTKENLQATVEELETSNEELQATNEELVASNEEMHSTNEELQSVNEEVYTVNHEYQRKISELTELTDDMNNLFQSIEVGVVFLDKALNIRRFTPKIAEIFRLLPQDLGRPINDFSNNMQDEKVFENLQTVLDTEKPFEEEAIDRRGNHWLLRIAPYRTKERIEGVVLTMIELNSVKETDAKLQRFADIVESTSEAIVGTDNEGIIENWNPGAEQLYGFTADEVIGKSIDIIVPEELKPETDEVIKQVIEGDPPESRRTTRLKKDGSLLYVGISSSCVYNGAGKIIGLSFISHDFTHQRTAELEQEKLSALVATTADFMGVADAKGKTLTLNPAGRAMIGRGLNEKIAGMAMADWHTEEQAKFISEEAIPQAIKDGQWRGTTKVTDGDGNQTPLSSIIIAHKDDESDVTHISYIGRDITQQTEFEGQLKDRETFLRRTLDGLSAFAGVLSPEGELINANRTSLEAANLKSEDAIGKPFVELRWWSHSTTVQKQLRAAIQRAATGEVVRYDTTMQMADDSVRDFEYQLTPLRNDEGEVTHIVSSGFDITERKELDTKQRVFGHAFESSLTAMVITDATKPENPIIYANPGFEKLSGYSLDESIGKNCRFLQGPESDQNSISSIRSAVKNGEAVRVKLLNYRKNGEIFWNELVITPVRNDKGELSNFIGVQFDVTKHLKVEQQLAHARDIAEAANTAKSSFVANMSHEIRTPLTTIVGMTEMLLDQENDKSKLDTLQLIHQSSRHLASLVNDVLDLSKIEAEKLESELGEVELMRVIEDVAASMHYRAKEKGLSFDLVYEGMIPETIRTDAVRLRQVLFNLGGNAIKFTEKGGVTVRCKLVDRESRPMLQIAVEDTGIGFKNSQVNELFEKFKQVDDSLTRRQGGSGLGLFISRRIVELIGGRLAAKGKPGVGSVFTLDLPTGDLSSRTMIDPNSLRSQDEGFEIKAEVDDYRLDGKRILVAEDTRGIQMLLKRVLENAGAEVEVAADGQMAVDVLSEKDNENSSYDLFVLDMHMPRLSGYDTASAIRRRGITAPIIALTASAMRGDREKCLAAGCDDYLTKPIDRQKLLEKITNLMTAKTRK